MTMQLLDRIEKRRFVGREFLLWLWFESELFDATLATDKHGPFGLWLERRLVLSNGKESTRVDAPLPGTGREAKEALLRGQLPRTAGIRIAWNGDETSFSLKAEQLAVSGLKLQTVLDKDDEPPSALIEELAASRTGKQAAKSADPDDAAYEAFYERMRLTEEFEALVATLYTDFLALRLGDAWTAHLLPALRQWAGGQAVDVEAYREARIRAAQRPARRSNATLPAPRPEIAASPPATS
jgi:hypothetical protein